MERELRTVLLDIADKFSAATGVSLATISRRAINDNTFFDRVRDGSGFTIRTFDRIIQWLKANWPEGHPWPDHTVTIRGECGSVQPQSEASDAA